MTTGRSRKSKKNMLLIQRSVNARSDGNSYRVLVVKPEGLGPLGRRTSKWEDNIKKDFQEVECGHELD